MTVYFAKAEILCGKDGKYIVRAFWDKHAGYGVDILYLSDGKKEAGFFETFEKPVFLTDRKAALKRFATKVKRISRIADES